MTAAVLAAAIVATNAVAGGTHVVVEASRMGSRTLEMPHAVEVITAREISASGARDVTDLLAKRCPQLNLTSMYGTNPAGRNLAFAGYGENGGGRALVLVDGERLNSADMSVMNLARIDMGSVRSVEILSGPQSVLHGDMASAGVVNIVTEPEDGETHGHAEVHGGSWNTVGASLGYRGGIAEAGIGYWANGGWEHSDGYRDNSGYDLVNAGGGAKWKTERGSSLKISAFGSHSDYDLPRALSRTEWKRHPRHSVQRDAKYPEERVDNFRQWAQGVNLTGLGVVDDENELRLTATASRTRTKSRMFGNGAYDDYDFATFDWLGLMDYVWSSYVNYDAYAFRVKPEWVNRTEIAGFERESVAGIELGYDRIEAESAAGMHYHPQYAASARTEWTRDDYRMDRKTMAFFGEETLHLNDRWAVAAGLRYEREWNRCTSARKARETDNLVAGDFAVNFTPTDGFKGYVRFSRFFRNAGLDELCYRGGSVPEETPDPETGWRVDAGAEWRWGGELTVRANGYFSETEDEIFYNPYYVYGAYGWSKDNVNSPDPVRRTGLDVALVWERERVASLAVAASLVRARFHGGQYDGNAVPAVPEAGASASGRIWLWSDGYVFGGVRYRAESYSISDFRNEYGRTPDFTVFHLGFAWEPTFAEWAKGWKASVTCDNLFDRDYCEYAAYGVAYYPAAGRSVMAALRHEF